MFKLWRVVWSPSTIARLHFSVHSSSRQKSNGNYFGRRYSLRTDGAGKTLTLERRFDAKKTGRFDKPDPSGVKPQPRPRAVTPQVSSLARNGCPVSVEYAQRRQRQR